MMAFIATETTQCRAGGLHRSQDHLMPVIAGSLLALVMVRRSDAMTATSASIAIHAKSAHPSRQLYKYVCRLNAIFSAVLAGPAHHPLHLTMKFRQRSLQSLRQMPAPPSTIVAADRAQPNGPKWLRCGT